MMHGSLEFVIAIVLGVTLVVVELATIWIVHWRTQVLLEHRGKLPLSPSEPFTLESNH
jgi:hypothetical protein